MKRIDFPRHVPWGNSSEKLEGVLWRSAASPEWLEVTNGWKLVPSELQPCLQLLENSRIGKSNSLHIPVINSLAGIAEVTSILPW